MKRPSTRLVDEISSRRDFDRVTGVLKVEARSLVDQNCGVLGS